MTTDQIKLGRVYVNNGAGHSFRKVIGLFISGSGRVLYRPCDEKGNVFGKLKIARLPKFAAWSGREILK